jgi:hypothetical protein
MRRTYGLVLLVVGFGLVGCSSRAYQRVDLGSNLGQDALARYESEYQDMLAAGHPEGMARLEHTNWWLPGLLAYYRRASVTRMPGPDGPTYHVESGQGFGPLCILYNTSNHATYSARGERLSGMGMHNVVAGHVAMIHTTDGQLPGGGKQEAFSMGLLHHLFNVHKMDGHTYVSFLTVPNPIGGALSGGHGGH